MLHETCPSLTRRGLLQGAAAWTAGAAALSVPGRSEAAMPVNWPLASGYHGIDERHLWIRQAGRSEELHVRFRLSDASIDVDGAVALTWLFRDWRDKDQVLGIDVWLLDRLALIQTILSVEHAKPVKLILTSGYRTRRRNATIEGAAANSQHVLGRAADIKAEGVSSQTVHKAAQTAGAHGLGRYARFTHIDTGPPGRRWRG